MNKSLYNGRHSIVTGLMAVLLLAAVPAHADDHAAPVLPVKQASSSKAPPNLSSAMILSMAFGLRNATGPVVRHDLPAKAVHARKAETRAYEKLALDR